MQSVCAFTGHRPEKLPWGSDESSTACNKAKDMLLASIFLKIGEGCSTFFTGMAQGADLIFAEQVFKTKESYPCLKLIAVLAHKDTAAMWDEKNQKRYRCILDMADEIVITGKDNTAASVMEHNKWMVDNAGHLIALYSGADGGSRNVVDYAKKRKQRNMIIIDPLTLEYQSEKRYPALEVLMLCQGTLF